jgi:hypothetical protein
MDELYTQRKFDRFDLGLEAQCIIGGNVMSIKCEVAEISRVGASMYLLINERLKPGQSVMLQIPVPGKITPVSAVVKLTWFKTVQGLGLYNFATGGKITYIKDEERDALLSYAYRRLIEQEKNA